MAEINISVCSVCMCWIGLQRAAILRKKFDIHISGQNVPAPLENFEELVSRLVSE